MEALVSVGKKLLYTPVERPSGFDIDLGTRSRIGERSGNGDLPAAGQSGVFSDGNSLCL